MFYRAKQQEFNMSLNAQGKPNKYEPALDDTSLMPFGKYKGEPMSDISASYLAWLWDNFNDFGLKCYVGNGTIGSNRMLANYIWNSRNDINEELGRTVIA